MWLSEEYVESGPRDTHNRRVNLAATILLSIAALATSWAGYQASLWSGNQLAHGTIASATRTRATRVADSAGQLRLIDVGLYVNWLEAYSRKDDLLAGFLAARFRREFRPAFTRWIASRPLQNALAEPTPFTLPEYHLQAQASADSLELAANREDAESQRANGISDSYVLDAVILATVMFFATSAQQDISKRMPWRLVLIALAFVACVVGLLRLATLPTA